MEEITYGLELEFVTPNLQAGARDPDAASELSAGQLQPRFVAEVDENDQDPYSEPGYSKVYRYIVDLINTVAPEQANMSIEARPDHSYKTWFVKEESTAIELWEVGDDYLDWNNVEITTPVFSTPVSHQGLQWSKSVVDVIRLIRQSCRVRTNSSCALHVHVGLRKLNSQDNKELQNSNGHLSEKLVTLKKLATLLWLAEDRIMTLCHPLRRKLSEGWSTSLRRSSFLDGVVYKMPLLTRNTSEDYATWLGSVFESAGSESDHKDVVAKMSIIWNARTWQQLSGFLKSPMTQGKLVFDFSQLGRIGTVEFRPMEASFDEALLKHWTAICTRLVIYANHQANDQTIQSYQNTIVNLLKDQSQYSIWDLLGDIFCPAQASWFKKKCARDEQEFQKLVTLSDGAISYPAPYYLPAGEARFFPPHAAEPWDIEDEV